MSKNSNLLQKIELFEKLATSSFEKFVQNHKVAMQSEVNAGQNACNKAVNKSEGIKQLQNAFTKLTGSLSQLTAESAASLVPQMNEIVGGAKFFTSEGNAGTGYDPNTRVGGVVSPAAYLDRTAVHLKNLSDAVAKNKPAPAPQKTYSGSNS